MNNEQTHDHSRSPRTPFVPTPINFNRNINNFSPFPTQNRVFNNFDPTPWRQTYEIPSFLRNYQVMGKLVQNDQQNPFDDMPLPMILENNNVSTIFQTPKMEKKLNFEQDDQAPQQISNSRKIKQEEPNTCVKSIENYSTKRKAKSKFIDYEYLATTSKKHNYCNLFDEQKKKKSNKEKGLRRLSQRAHEIVLQMKSATYKQVALKLSEELLTQRQLAYEGKEEQNIKRRVYDALNVLIALGKLKKQGRKIVVNKQCQVYKGEPGIKIQDTLQQHDNIYQTYCKLKKNVQQKRVIASTAKMNYKAIKSLIERNAKLCLSTEKIIPFPIIGVPVASINEENIHLSKDELRLVSSGKLDKHFGDLDIVNYLEYECGQFKKTRQI